MKRRVTRTARTIMMLGVSAALMVTAGCGSTTPEAAADGPRSKLDKALQALVPSSIRADGVLRVATDASYAPMSSFGADGRTIIGMEPDLGAELGRILGLKVKFVQRDFAWSLGQRRRIRWLMHVTPTSPNRFRDRL